MFVKKILQYFYNLYINYKNININNILLSNINVLCFYFPEVIQL